MGRSSGSAGRRLALTSALLWPLLAASVTLAQDVHFNALVNARECRALLPLQGKLYGALAEGGVLVWNAADPTTPTHWTVADGLSGLRVTSLAWTGQNLWVATEGSALTRVTLEAGGPVFRQFSNIGGLDVTSVAGFTRGSGEILYYGLRAGGVGIIISGLPGIVYTSAVHGLVDDHVRALALQGDALWVGTTGGVSRFADNVFTTANAGLPDLSVQTLCAAGDTLLLCGTASGGVARWDSTSSAWQPLAGLTGNIVSIAAQGGGVWALRDDGAPDGPTLWRWDGALWSQSDVPTSRTRVLAAEPGPAGRLWAAGGHTDAGMDPRAGRAFLSLRGDAGWTTWPTNEMIFLAVDGCAFAPDGSVWLGSRQGLGVARRAPDGLWTQVYQVASAANDSTGLFKQGSNILNMVTLPNGEVWFTQFQSGVIRLMPGDPAIPSDDQFDFLTSADSGLPDNRILRIVRHPDGPLIFVSDQSGASVLLDPARWRDPTQWVKLPTTADGLGGAVVRAAVVARRDQVWFAVEGIGLVAWDINGSAGPDAALTWSVAADNWGSPLPALSGTLFDLRRSVSLAAASDGTLWAGGSGGVVHFAPGDRGAGALLLDSFREKSDVFVDGLLTGSVHDIELDARGDLWVGTDAGLNRIRIRDDGTHIDAYTDLASFSSYGFGLLYLPSIIAGLPGGQVWELTADPGSGRLLVGSESGAALVDIGPRPTGAGTDLSPVYFYPNPLTFDGSSSGQLKLGGVKVTTGTVMTLYGPVATGGAEVYIYTADGQLVFSDMHVASDTAFWNGRNSNEVPVASGLYLVRLVFGGGHAMRTLAVIR